jgi:3-hydroxyisobutyrate dehydrogenase-like beta-hydroxyacid dehydrogenase
MELGLIGIGTMGCLVASTLLQSGRKLVAYDVDPRGLQRARNLGAVTVDSPQAVAERAGFVLLLLPGPAQIEAVVAGPEGLLVRARPGQVIVDMSTVDPETTRRMGIRAEKAGVGYVDAPILGRPSALGRWVLPVGGDAEAVARVRPVLESLACKVIHVGPLGAGNTVKLLNSLMFSAINAMTAEIMAVCKKVGLSPKAFFETVAVSNAATVSGLFQEVGAKIVARDFAPDFSVDLLCKDNGLAIAMAQASNATPIVASVIQVMNELARSRGLGAEDSSALVKVYEALLDVECDATD